MLADEPVASLDPATSKRVLTLIHDICKADGIAAVVSLHQLELARQFADRIVGITAGSVVFDGSASRLGPAVVERIYAGAAHTTADSSRPAGLAAGVPPKLVTALAHWEAAFF